MPAAGAVPDNIANRVDQLKKELAEAEALQADLAVDQEKNGNSALSIGEVALVKAAAPATLAEQIAEVEQTPAVVTQELLDASKGAKLSDDEIVDLIGPTDAAPTAA